MDMFVYSVPRILRYLSLMNHTIVIYDMKGILQELQISHKDLRQICVLSGTDYNINVDSKKDNTLYSILKIFKKYKKNTIKQDDFYEWLIHNTNHISDYELLNKIYDLFDLTLIRDNLKSFDNIRILNGRVIREEIRNILSTDGFVFPMSASL